MSARSIPTYQRCVRPRGLFIGTATVMCLMILTTPIKAQSGTPNLPPVRYQIQLWTVLGAINLEVIDTNNQRQTVGSIGVDTDSDGVADSNHGYLYDPNITLGVAVDLNDIVEGIPLGWHIRKATAINEVGQIAAYIEPTGSTSLSVLQAVVINMKNLPMPKLQIIPDRAFTFYSVTGNINDFGDVTVRYKNASGTWGHYVYNVYNTNPLSAISDLGVSASPANPKINNRGVIVGELSNGNGYRTSLNGGFETFAGLRPRAINEDNAFCGTASVTTTKPRRTTLYAFVYGTSQTLNKIANSATDLNKSLDSVVSYQWLNHSTLGNLKIIDLLDKRDPNSSLINPSCSTMTDRVPVINFPVLCGSTSFGASQMGIHLIPVSVP